MSKFYLIILEIHDFMLPKKAISKNFFREHSKDSRGCYLMEIWFLVLRIKLINFFMHRLYLNLSLSLIQLQK